MRAGGVRKRSKADHTYALRSILNASAHETPEPTALTRPAACEAALPVQISPSSRPPRYIKTACSPHSTRLSLSYTTISTPIEATDGITKFLNPLCPINHRP